MEEMLMRAIENLGDRLSGPGKFRFLLQPAVAITLAVIAGLKDAKTGQPPYLWTIFTDPLQRAALLKDGWKSVGKVFLIALALDVGYQAFVLKFVYPGEALVVAFALAILPYMLLRGVVTRLAR